MLVFHIDNLAKGNAMTTVAAALPLEQTQTLPQKLFSGLTSTFQTAAKKIGNFTLKHPGKVLLAGFAATEIILPGSQTLDVLNWGISAIGNLTAESVSNAAIAAGNEIANTAVGNVNALGEVAQIAVTDTADKVGMVAETITQNPLNNVADSIAVLEEKGLVEATKDSFAGAIEEQVKTFVKYTMPFLEHYAR